MTVSVVIPTYNGIDTITQLLERLKRQNNSNFNVTVINDGSTEKIRNQLEQLPEKYNFSLEIITQVNSGRAAARNFGASKSSSELIIFLDDDMLLGSDFIENHLNFHLHNPNCILIGSGYRDPNKANTDFLKYLVAVEKNWKNKNSIQEKVTFQKFVFTACNMSIPKNLFHQLKGFDERLKDGEDFDFGVRALNEQQTIIYNPSITSWHNDLPDIKTLINRHNQYNKGKKELLRYHPEYLELFPEFISKNRNNPLKKNLLNIFKHTFSHSVITNRFLFTILPLNLKFILYKATIAAHCIED